MSLRCCLRSRGRGEARAWLGDRRQRTKKRARGAPATALSPSGDDDPGLPVAWDGSRDETGRRSIDRGELVLVASRWWRGRLTAWKPSQIGAPKKDRSTWAGLLGWRMDGPITMYSMHHTHSLTHIAPFPHLFIPTARQCTGDLTTPVQGRGLRSRTLLRGRPRRAPPGAGGSRTPRATSSTRCCRPSTRGGFAF